MRQSSLAKFGIVGSKSKTADSKIPDFIDDERKSPRKKDVGKAAS